ncbi:GTP-binding protein 10 [Oopsacas minuta]|uniref:GTP-binding protein 10 n=1 Tax=Oopsacas minuta TaxID=111878 RepID=A0AAV7JAT0_9METZ|nr:GTP-binding protein 10 [Oopsacas minuta]
MMSFTRIALPLVGNNSIKFQLNRCVANKKRLQGRLRDNIYIYVVAGSGGQGIEKLGKIGGDGGSVYAVAERRTSLEQLVRFKNKFVGSSGDHADWKRLRSKSGRDLYLPVPRGTVVWRADGSQLTDLNREGQEVLLVRGGKGGGPDNISWTGGRGNRSHFRFELKLIADSGLVGYPNAGKSTLLNKISRATPKIADYPFTTLRPHLGSVWYPDNKNVTVADLPGLIEGAHLDRGMGHKFLRHIERTNCLVFMVDINGYKHSLTHPFISPLRAIINLGVELDLYLPGLCERESILLVNKMDSEGAEEKYDNLLNDLKSYMGTEHRVQFPMFQNILPISAKYSQGLDEFKTALKEIIETINIEKQREREEQISADSNDDISFEMKK